ncbi:unnamed protein product [Nyctereutes procyonoides]|uniref:(raccoon dog) hypothetical protein n=1 Tax=Nyctereutes procyonoides TaxID=34880 RepID=A0A811ZY28_NYCPR|nr:unnamed protein product [Nyctereutes procyonoides]
MADSWDPVSEQMKLWKEQDKLNVMTAGPRGPLLVQDVVFTDEMAHFDQERISERVVQAKGAGAFGYFEVTHDITKYSKTKVFEHIGKRTPIEVRFSTVAGESGPADTIHDPRGFAVKFYTEDGNWDLVGNNTPIFFIRDVILFPSFIHSQKRNPQTHLKDLDMVWDFWSLHPESAPDGHRHMNGYGLHTFKLVNADQGIKNFSVEDARLSHEDPDYSLQDLFNAIATADTFPFNPFDLTKIWPHQDYPLIPVGKLVLNRNPVNYFTEVEQPTFDPSNVPPGIEPSSGKMLQEPNYLQIPMNYPFRAGVTNYQHDGPIFSAPEQQCCVQEHSSQCSLDVQRFNSANEDNVTQRRKHLCENTAGHLKDAQVFMQKKAVKNFSDDHPDYGACIQALLDKYNGEKAKTEKANL